MNNAQIAVSWELWKEYMDPKAEDTRERFESLTIEQRLAELERCFGPDEPKQPIQEIETMEIESNKSYLKDGSVLTNKSQQLCGRGPAGAQSVLPPEGIWLKAATDFHLPGGWGGRGLSEWRDAGADIAKGQRFRLLSVGCPESAAVWETETGEQ